MGVYGDYRVIRLIFTEKLTVGFCDEQSDLGVFVNYERVQTYTMTVRKSGLLDKIWIGMDQISE
jgi:hypothetical protein